jgi:phosphoenolpyruvate---glycerone phosphotransferase subunit DhaL
MNANAVASVRPLDADGLRLLVEAVAGTVIAHADELTDLDRAIGDADHGLNMKRGFEAVLADLGASSAKPLPEALKSIGMTLVMKVGGASGPLFGTLFMTLGKELPATFDRADLLKAVDATIAAVKARGKSDVGQKTMLDVLVPARDAFEMGKDPAAAADAAADATIPMQAVRGRASFLGARSAGHMDPGARSSALIIRQICEFAESWQ